MTNSKKTAKKLNKAQNKLAKVETKLVRTEAKQLARASNALQQQRVAASALKIPKMVKPKGNPHLMKYLRALVDPESMFTNQVDVRVPDAFSRATATLRSFVTYDVVGNYSTDSDPSDLGRFCYVLTPTLSSLGWIEVKGTDVVIYGNENGTVQTMGTKLVLGANCATPNPSFTWSPATSLQVYTPAPKKSGKIAFSPPILPTVNSWNFYADPNAAAVGGTQVGTTLGIVYEGGAAESIRPVAQSVWFSPSMAMMSNGGNVAIALLPPDSLFGQIAPYNFQSCTDADAVWSGQGPIANWENLARVPGAYTGPLSKGCYGYWVPSRISDIDMASVGENVIRDFPTLVVAGQSQGAPGIASGTSTTSYTGLLGTVRVTTLYEYTTCDQSRSTLRTECVPGAFDFIQCALKNVPRCMENETHRSWIDKVLAFGAGLAGGAAGFFVGGPAGAVALGGASATAMYSALASSS